MTLETYQLYLAFLVGSFTSFGSINNYLSLLKQINIVLGADISFFSSHQIASLKMAAKRVLAAPPNRKAPITIEILLAIHNLSNFSDPYHVCMWAVFVVAFFSLLRKSNLVPNSVSDTLDPQAAYLKKGDVVFFTDHCILTVHKTKTIQFRQRVLEIILPTIPNSVLCPVTALKHQIKQSPGNSHSPLFTIPATATAGTYTPVTGHRFSSFLKSSITAVGLDPSKFSPHSFRRGGSHICIQVRSVTTVHQMFRRLGLKCISGLSSS